MKKILAIDDDNNVVTTIKKFFENKKDYTVITALNGRDGLQAAREEDPDIILLDVMMPEMNGLEVLKRLAAKESTRYIPVLMLSGVDDEETIDEAIYNYVEQYIIKPFDLPVLQSRIEHILAAREPKEKRSSKPLPKKS